MGFFFALLSSASFGLIPLFSLPLLHNGMSAGCVLFYRFLFGSLALVCIVILRHERLIAPLKELISLALFSIMYALAALLLFYGFHYLPSGVASTLQFLYPLMVMLIMILFFHEKFSLITASSVALAILGVFLLGGGEGGRVSVTGIALLLVSALCNALYICGLHVARIRSISGLSITFWVLFFGMIASFINAVCTNSFTLLHTWQDAGIAVLLALITAVLSNLTLVLAIQRIGSTLSSILGVMEPLTAVTVGIFVFDEPANAAIFFGVAVICASVILVLAGPIIQKHLGKKTHA